MPRRPKPVRMQGYALLKWMFAKGKGTSKYQDKKMNGGKPAKDKIYCHQTLKTYIQGWDKFCDYLKASGIRSRDLSDLPQYVQGFIDDLVEQHYSASTITTWAAAVVKVLGLNLQDFHKPPRRRADYKRSRYPVKNDACFSPEKHRDLWDFCLSVGPRKGKELRYIRGSDLTDMGDGTFAVNIRRGKGGRQRFAPIVGPRERTDRVVNMMRAAGDGLVFPKIPAAADVHALRAEYAATVYRMNARPIEEVPRAERYYCKRDMAGTVYDKRAMLAASNALGHNRISVVAQSYLWTMRREN